MFPKLLGPDKMNETSMTSGLIKNDPRLIQFCCWESHLYSDLLCTLEIPIVFCCHSQLGWINPGYRLSPLHACRIGEADNPGPAAISYKIGLINPTSVYNKQDDIQSLQCHTYALSETSATASVQAEMDFKFRQMGFRSAWSPPVAPHLACTYDTAKRGQASGVPVHSHFPLTRMELNLDDSIDATRIISTVVHVGPWYINIIVLYGIPSCHAKSREVTDQLLYQAGLQAAKSKLPSLIIGDFNHPTHLLRSMATLSLQGYRSTSDLYENMYGTTMPYTCRESTCNDQMIVHPDLIPFLEQIQVDKQKLFSDHDPVLCTFQLPGEILPTKFIKHPSTWTSFDPDPKYVAIAFAHYAKKKGLPILSEDDNNLGNLDEALTQWTIAVENSIDWSLKMQHADDPKKYPVKNLPTNAKGRAKMKKIIQKPGFSWNKPACEGQYTPLHSFSSILLKQKVRQVRRIQSLYYRLTKLCHIENGTWMNHLQLQQEWKAILQAPGFKPNFSMRCANIPEIGWCPLQVPQPDYLHLIAQFVKMECDQLASKVAATTRKMTRYNNLRENSQTIYSRAAKKVKKTSPDVIQEIREQIVLPAQLVQNCDGLLTLQVESTCILQTNLPITYAGIEATINDVTETAIDIYLQDIVEDIPNYGEIKQNQCHSSPDIVASKLDEYWGQFWCRDSNKDCQNPINDDDPWTNFQTWLDATPVIPEAPVVLDDYHLWENAIKQMNPKTARGIDSWTVDELRSLPSIAIKSLSQIFHRFQGQPFPERWLIALTIPLGKQHAAHTAAKTRPITVLSLLYRLWSKVVTTQVLKHWSQHLPGYIVGFIPGRSPQNEMIKIQHEFECSHTTSGEGATQWQGITLDLVKCFNLIPREPAKRALRKAGVPEAMIQVWFQSLMKLVRYWKLRDSVVESGLTTTGTPEGDTFSVLCCVAISRIWAHHLSTHNAIPSCYADNWSWRCRFLEDNLSALTATRAFTRHCRLKIDWDKTWAWITYHLNKAAWKAAMKLELPREATLHVVTSARELGYTMHYNKNQSRATQKQRHQEALQQVLRIRRMPVSLQIKAQLLTDACLSKAFSQTETYHVGNPWFKELRTAMSRTLVPDRKITNPYLAVMLLSKFTIDPELYYIRQCIRSIRRFLINTDDATRSQFLVLAAKHNLKPMQVHGPAGTLATSLAKLGWKITADGTIYTDSMLNLHLLSSPLASILHSTVHTWMKNISQFCSTRPEWRNLPPIDRGSTLKVFMQLPQEQQNTVAKFLTGSYMDANQREHIREGPVTCDICQQDDDTIVHRLLNCPNTQYVRQEHTEVITFLETFDPCYLHLPVVFQDDQVDFNTWFFHQPWEPVINDLVKQQIWLENQQGIRSKIYSDGTCRNPASPSYRRAAFALVFHTCTSIQQCVEIVSQFRTAQKTPSTFQVLSTGACSGFQSIPRAELEAAMVLMQQDLMTTLYTDSQYVVDICDRLGYILDVAQMQSWPNFDILLTIWNHLQLGKTNIVKVKAHDISDKDPPEETFNKIGNHAADTAAKEALKQLDRTTPMHQNFTQHVELLEMAKQQMQFRYHIQVARAKCLQQKDNNHHPQTYVTFQANQERLLELHYDDGIQYDFDDTDQDKLQNSLWGTTISLRILAWLQLLRWPSTPADPGAIGITWYELAVNFQTVMQCGLVVNAGGTGKTFQPRQLPLLTNEWPYSRQVQAFERVVTTMAQLIGRNILPIRRQLSSSIRLLGSTHGKQGLIDRPQMVRQTETLSAIIAHFSKHKGATPDAPPPIPDLPASFDIPTPPSDSQDREDWTRRISRYNSARKRR